MTPARKLLNRIHGRGPFEYRKCQERNDYIDPGRAPEVPTSQAEKSSTNARENRECSVHVTASQGFPTSKEDPESGPCG